MRSRDGTIKLAETPISRRYSPKLLSLSLSLSLSVSLSSLFISYATKAQAMMRSREQGRSLGVGVFKAAVVAALLYICTQQRLLVGVSPSSDGLVV